MLRLLARAAHPSGPVLVIGISGPDGAGKTRLAEALARRLGAEGRGVATVHPYGCVVCRRLPDSLRSDPAEANGARGSRLIRLRRALHVVHGLVDASELALQLRRVRAEADAEAGHLGPPIVIADRSALDGLVKFRPRRGALLERVYRRLALAFDLILLLEASPATLARRDGEHSERILALLAERFATAALGLPPVRRIETERPFQDVVADAAVAIDPLIQTRDVEAPSRVA
jgi:thymidylate kinase